MVILREKCPICGQRTELRVDNEQLRAWARKCSEIVTKSLFKKVLVTIFISIGMAGNIIGCFIGGAIAYFLSGYLAKAINEKYYHQIEERIAPRDYAYRCITCNEMWHKGEDATALINTHYQILRAKTRVKYIKRFLLIFIPYLLLMIPVGFVMLCYWFDCMAYGSDHTITQQCWDNSVLDVFGWVVSYTKFAFTFGLIWMVPVAFMGFKAVKEVQEEWDEKLENISSY